MKLQHLFELSAQIHRENEAFKAWFGHSKIVNDDGDPAVCYHATAADFKKFIPGGLNPKLSGAAMWFSMDPHNQPAAHNIRTRTGYKDGVHVMPVYIRMERPLVIDDMPSLEWAREVFAKGSREFPQLMASDWVAEVTHDGEYDGIIFDAVKLGWEDAVVELIVFNPNQVKSALGNSGTFSKDDDDITK